MFIYLRSSQLISFEIIVFMACKLEYMNMCPLNIEFATPLS